LSHPLFTNFDTTTWSFPRVLRYVFPPNFGASCGLFCSPAPPSFLCRGSFLFTTFPFTAFLCPLRFFVAVFYDFFLAESRSPLSLLEQRQTRSKRGASFPRRRNLSPFPHCPLAIFLSCLDLAPILSPRADVISLSTPSRSGEIQRVRRLVQGFRFRREVCGHQLAFVCLLRVPGFSPPDESGELPPKVDFIESIPSAIAALHPVLSYEVMDDPVTTRAGKGCARLSFVHIFAVFVTVLHWHLIAEIDGFLLVLTFQKAEHPSPRRGSLPASLGKSFFSARGLERFVLRFLRHGSPPCL